MPAKKIKIELGSAVKEKVTGFKGIVVGKTEWLNGCIRFGVQSPNLHDGKPVDIQWFDQADLVVVKKAAVTATPKKPGGPQQDPSSRY